MLNIKKYHIAFDTSPPPYNCTFIIYHKLYIMKSLSIILFIISLNLVCFSQASTINEFGLSTSLIWNKTTIFNSYSGARAKDITGTALSNGINLNYSRSIYKNFHAKVGIGYFKQKFGIIRGFDFKETVITTGLGYSTKYYQYKNLQYTLGIGYNKLLTKNYVIKLCATYNYLNTFQQEFRHTLSGALGNTNPQIRKENYYFGSYFNLEGGVSKKVYKKFSVGLDILFPVYIKWRKDEIFREDFNEFYGSDFSIGTSINLIYSFNKK